MEYIIPAALEPWQAGTSYAKGAGRYMTEVEYERTN